MRKETTTMRREDEMRVLKRRAFRASFHDDEAFVAEMLALAAELAVDDNVELRSAA